MTITKTVFRTLFYQFLLLFVGLSVGFLLNAEYVGWKAPVVGNSFYNIFYPIDFEDEGVLESLYKKGQFKIYSFNNYPKDFKIIEQAMMGEEWYWCKYSYKDKKGNTKTNIDHTRLRWKPWEYYYEDDARKVWSEEEMRKYIQEGSLNSRETDRAFRLRDELALQYKHTLLKLKEFKDGFFLQEDD
jgi:hypothetical protein